MLYIERTNRVRNVIRARPNLCERVRQVFEAHFEDNGEAEWLGKGNSRMAYEIGVCEVPEGQLSLLLKLFKKDRSFCTEYSMLCPRGRYKSVREEFGAFEVYYDYVAGTLDRLSFPSDEVYAVYAAKMSSHPSLMAPKVIDMTDRWNGTEVERGDFGAIPYFQMAVRYKQYFGILTEGLPPVIEPKRTARAAWDDYTVERGRIIDLSPTQCRLSEINHGFGSGFDDYDNLGLVARGTKYFGRHNRLDL